MSFFSRMFGKQESEDGQEEEGAGREQAAGDEKGPELSAKAERGEASVPHAAPEPAKATPVPRAEADGPHRASPVVSKAPEAAARPNGPSRAGGIARPSHEEISNRGRTGPTAPANAPSGNPRTVARAAPPPAQPGSPRPEASSLSRAKAAQARTSLAGARAGSGVERKETRAKTPLSRTSPTAGPPGSERKGPAGISRTRGERTSSAGRPSAVSRASDLRPSRRSQEPKAEAAAAPVSVEVIVDSSVATSTEAPSSAIVAQSVAEAVAAVSHEPSPPPRPDPRKLLTDRARTRTRPLTEFLKALRWGEATSEWVGACEGALEALAQGAQDLEIADVSEAVSGVREALSAVSADSSLAEKAAWKNGLRNAFSKMVESLPDAFAPQVDYARCEAAAIERVLAHVPGLSRGAIDELTAAKLTRFEAFYRKTSADLAQTCDLDASVAQAICTAFARQREQAYLCATEESAHAFRVSSLDDLREAQRQYTQAAAGWTRQALATRRASREERARLLGQLEVHLAREGEMELLALLERLPFDRKIEVLEHHVMKSEGSRARAA